MLDRVIVLYYAALERVGSEDNYSNEYAQVYLSVLCTRRDIRAHSVTCLINQDGKLARPANPVLLII